MLYWLIKQKKGLSAKKSISQYEFLPYLHLIMNITLKVHGAVPERASVWGVDKGLRELSWILRISESYDIDWVLILCQSGQGLGWDMDCVCRSKGLSENHSSGLCQMTGNEAWHKYVCLVSTLSKNSEAGLQHLWTNTNKINPVTKGGGHTWQRRDWGRGSNQKKRRGEEEGEKEERKERNKRKKTRNIREVFH